ncbi:MAG: NADH-quinone oxidoreductase subunit NuoK [Planctomycetota bacterium]|nr:MAG: NADH-quinone oxidoreductase subunit NuoK [Planctomycetota bacterium]
MLALEQLLYISAFLFSIGTFGVLTARNFFVVLMSVEILLAAVSLSFAVFSRILANGGGQIFIIFIIAVAAAEAAIGLALMVAFFRNTHSVETDEAQLMKG